MAGPDLEFERAAAAPVAGVDEAGRGPWAGPVVAAAVVLDPGAVPEGLDDSKTLTAARREVLLEAIEASAAAVGVGMAGVDEIDRLDILRAAMLAMARAVEALPARPAHALVDGDRVSIRRGDLAGATPAASRSPRPRSWPR